MGRNGDAPEMWRLTTSTVSATCTEAVPVQESLWKFMPTTTTSRGPAVKIIRLFLLPLFLRLFLTPQSTLVVFHLSFLDLLLASHTTNPLWSPLHPTRNQGGYSFFFFFCPFLSLVGWWECFGKVKGKELKILVSMCCFE
jgi:hypothetical protein